MQRKKSTLTVFILKYASLHALVAFLDLLVALIVLRAFAAFLLDDGLG